MRFKVIPGLVVGLLLVAGVAGAGTRFRVIPMTFPNHGDSLTVTVPYSLVEFTGADANAWVCTNWFSTAGWRLASYDNGSTATPLVLADIGLCRVDNNNLTGAIPATSDSLDYIIEYAAMPAPVGKASAMGMWTKRSAQTRVAGDGLSKSYQIPVITPTAGAVYQQFRIWVGNKDTGRGQPAQARVNIVVQTDE